ncbi:MAG: hypothetical protein ABSH20_08495 [Tepidisphaeraceae bacterium]|jgi:hypothetical protein
MTGTASAITKSAQLPRGLAGPLLLWLALQFGVLFLAGLQTPLSDKFTRPAERRAIEEMLVAQIAVSSLLFPVILDGLWATLAAIATAWPMLALAGVLSVRSTGEVVRGATYVSLWIGLLGVWSWILPGRRSRLIGCAVAAGLSIGGGLLAYLQIEFDTTAATTWADVGFRGPILPALSAAAGWNWEPWNGLLYLIVITTVVAAVRIVVGRLRK